MILLWAVITIWVMTIAAHGIDMVDCERLGEMIDRYDQRFLNRVFTPAEIEYCQGRKRRIERCPRLRRGCSHDRPRLRMDPAGAVVVSGRRGAREHSSSLAPMFLTGVRF